MLAISVVMLRQHPAVVVVVVVVGTIRPTFLRLRLWRRRRTFLRLRLRRTFLRLRLWRRRRTFLRLRLWRRRRTLLRQRRRRTLYLRERRLRLQEAIASLYFPDTSASASSITMFVTWLSIVVFIARLLRGRSWSPASAARPSFLVTTPC